MSKREIKSDRIIDFLNKELGKLAEEIKLEQGTSKDKIELKTQMIDAINNLKLFSNHNLYHQNIEIIKIPEGGSDAHFTEFNIVDEKATEKVPEWAIKRDKNGEIKIDCYDLIIKRKKQ